MRGRQTNEVLSEILERVEAHNLDLDQLKEELDIQESEDINRAVRRGIDAGKLCFDSEFRIAAVGN